MRQMDTYDDRVIEGRLAGSTSAEVRRKSGAGSLRRASSLERRCRWWPDDTTPGLNLLFTWRRRYGTDVEGSGGSANFVPAVISTDAMAQAPVSSQAVAVSFSGRMEIELPGGCRLVAGNDVDTAVLGDVLKILLGR